ncbi:hypothetical protein K7432_003476 [Basidiobolus ranarum]|uniref:Uncharacterized protein n=1 Tax=Basidiobolus ranarum TaxID=34480 RepID=A0ABR2W703_9FUNG
MAQIQTQQTCCGCINLRVGCLLLTILQMLLGIVGCVLSVLIIIGISNGTVTASQDYPKDLLWAGSFVLLIASVLVFSVGLIGVIGVAKSKSTVLSVYLFLDTLSIICSIGGIILAFKNRDLGGGIQSIVLILFQVYFFSVIFRYRREVKAIKRDLSIVQFRRIESPVV